MSGRSTRAPAISCGTIPIRRIKGDHIGQRGVAIYKDWLFFVSPDAHLVSLNAKDGTVRWIVQLADVEKGYWATEAPFIVGNHVIVGVGGDIDNLPMFLRSIDPETGTDAMAMECHPSAGSRHDHGRHNLDGRHL